jgi:hypothetical protein
MAPPPTSRSADRASSLQRISPRVIFIALAVLLIWQLLRPISLPMYVSAEAQGLYDAVDRIPPDKILVIAADWAAGTNGESAPQTEAIMRHCMEKGIKFAVLGMVLQGPDLSQEIGEAVGKEFHRTYGVDWCNWGFKPGGYNMLTAWAKNIPGTIKHDIRGDDVSKLPMMASVHSVRDVGLIIDVTGSSTLEDWLQFVQGVYRTPMGYACTGVLGPEAYPYLDSGQLRGILVGLKGAAEYEKLVKYPDNDRKHPGRHLRGRATYEMSAQSVAHVLIILLIILGNLGYLRARRGKGAPQ